MFAIESDAEITLQTARILFQQQKFPEAIQSAITKPLQSTQLDLRAQALLIIGASYFHLNQHDKSIEYLKNALQHDPNLVEAYYNLGNALKLTGRFIESKECLEQALGLRPSFIDARLSYASVLAKLGEIDQSIKEYFRVVTLYPNMIQAYYNMGVLLLTKGAFSECSAVYYRIAELLAQEGDKQKALEFIREACKIDKNNWQAYKSYGLLLKEVGNLQEAFNTFLFAASNQKNVASLYFEAALIAECMGENDKAIQLYSLCTTLEPHIIDYYHNMGNLLRIQGRFDEAYVALSAALNLNPTFPSIYNNIGNIFLDKNNFVEAAQYYQKAIEMCPNFTAAHCNLAACFKAAGDFQSSISHSLTAIQTDPTFVDAYNNLGNVYKELGDNDKAIDYYNMAIRIKPDFAVAFSNLANVYKDAGRINEAIEWYRHAVSICPDFSDAFSNLVHSLIFICDWNGRDKNFRILVEMVKKQIIQGVTPSCQPFHCFVYPLDPSDKLIIAKKYAERDVKNAFLQQSLYRFDYKNEYLKNPLKKRLKVGYVSSDFGNHPLSHLMNSVFGMHDKSQFEIVCISLAPDDNSVYRKKVMEGCSLFLDFTNITNTHEAAKIINDLDIDVLVNLNGYTKGARNSIFALKPAPVQMSVMGYPGTMGAEHIQYILSDKVVTPSEYTSYYSEKVIYMPHSYFVNDYAQAMSSILDPYCERPTREKYGLPTDKFLFANFNQLYKIDPDTFRVWMRILHKVPNSVLWLLKFPELGEINIKKEANAYGIHESRIIFTDVIGKEEHISRCNLADLCLDTPLCNGHTTTCDLLWGGLPMVTLPLKDMASRVAASLCVALECPEMIATTHEEYEKIAIKMATGDAGTLEQGFELPRWIKDRQGSIELKKLRAKIEKKRKTAPLFNTKLWVKNFEEGLKKVWTMHMEGRIDHVSV